MTKLEKVIYTAKVHTTGGRDGGASRSDDGHMDIRLSLPGTRRVRGPIPAAVRRGLVGLL